MIDNNQINLSEIGSDHSIDGDDYKIIALQKSDTDKINFKIVKNN